MTVVRHEARRRWIVVLAAVAVLVALPVTASAWPAKTAKLDTDVLRERIRASTGLAYQGYAESVGALGLPSLPRLGQIVNLLSATTRMRAWYAARDRWRVDVVDTGSERGTYQAPDGQYYWDYGANQLTYVPAPEPLTVIDSNGVQLGFGVQQPSVRLPRAADLMPPDLARRLLSTAAGDRVEAIAGRNVAGIAAAGLRITSTAPHTAIGYIDIWADPRTGLPLQVEVAAHNAERPVLVTRFLDVDLTAPAAGVLTPPTRREELSVTVTEASDVFDGILEPNGLNALPSRLAGLPRRAQVGGPPPSQDGRPVTLVVSPIAVYGTGLAQVVVLPLASRVGTDAYRSVSTWGQRFTFAAGTGALVSTSLLSVMVVDGTRRARRSGRPPVRQSYLVAGMVDGELLRQIGAELAGGVR